MVVSALFGVNFVYIEYSDPGLSDNGVLGACGECII